MNKPLALIVVTLVLFAARMQVSSFTSFSMRLVTVSSEGEQANWDSGPYAISPEGRYVAFASYASNLVPNDNNNMIDLFLRDIVEDTTSRIVQNIGNIGGAACGIRPELSISNDANFITFVSHCPEIVPGDNNNELDVFVFDRVGNTVERISLKSDGSESTVESQDASITGDGRYVAFTSSYLTEDDTTYYPDLYIYNRLTHQTQRLINNWENNGQPGNQIACPVISKDGSTIAFASLASNLVPDDTNNQFDVFVYNISSGVTERVSVNNVGVQANASSNCPSISDDGQVVVFESMATNLVVPDNNYYNYLDIFLYDLTTNQIFRLSENSGGELANYHSYHPRISGNGRNVTWHSKASNLVEEDNNNYCGAAYLENCEDVFLYDRIKDELSIVSLSYDGLGANSGSGYPEISHDGRTIIFDSSAFNLVENDNNYNSDTFVFTLPPELFIYLPIVFSD